MAVNGELNIEGLEKAKKYCDKIFVRENTGYDAAAYKYVLCKCLNDSDIDFFDEIIICNNSFYGPFKHFNEIILDMESRPCDFWGLNGYTNILWNHIQSYFIVFRNSAIPHFIKYLNEYIEYDSNCIFYVVAQFEIGLFDYLTKQMHLSYDIYAKNHTYDIYTYPLEAIRNYNLQIVKRKSFYDNTTNETVLRDTISYIRYNTDYPIEMIKDEWNTIDTKIQKNINLTVPSYESVKVFAAEKEFYIYGNGIAAMNVYWLFGRNNINFQGFIVSDEFYRKDMTLFGQSVYPSSEIGDDIAVIISLINPHRAELLSKHSFKEYLCVY